MTEAMIAFYIFILACFIGYMVVWGVTPSLHTPLISLTNAISGIIIVGAILVAGFSSVESSAESTMGGYSELTGFIAITLASINIFGGFVVTQRMLSMFQKKKNKAAKS